MRVSICRCSVCFSFTTDPRSPGYPVPHAWQAPTEWIRGLFTWIRAWSLNSDLIRSLKRARKTCVPVFQQIIKFHLKCSAKMAKFQPVFAQRFSLLFRENDAYTSSYMMGSKIVNSTTIIPHDRFLIQAWVSWVSIPRCQSISRPLVGSAWKLQRPETYTHHYTTGTIPLRAQRLLNLHAQMNKGIFLHINCIIMLNNVHSPFGSCASCATRIQ